MDPQQIQRSIAVLQLWQSAAAFVIQIVARVAALYNSPRYWSQRMHTSALSGQAWVNELIDGHPNRIRINFGMPLHVYAGLLIELRRLGVTDGRYISLEEKAGIFLYTCVTGLGSRLVCERFQRSKSTVTSAFREILLALSSPAFYNKHVRLPTVDDPPAAYIRDNAKFWPFLEKCLGALDGTHILCSPSAQDRPNMRNRKGALSQNVLAICNFDFRFVYVLSGWDGSQTDSFIYSDARVNDLPMPDSCYYLGDAGFPQCPQVLVPYRGVRYHLREWAAGNQKPRNKEELFNLRHAQARNIVERIFGVMKNRWRVLVVPMQYSMELQAKIPIALCALHNFILDMEGSLGMEALAEEMNLAPPPRNVGTLATQSLTHDDLEGGKELQDIIAEAMWTQYQDYLAARGANGEDELGDVREHGLERAREEEEDDEEDDDGMDDAE